VLRPTATVVVLAWNAWQATETCLRTLLPTLADGDHVVVVDNGSVDGTAEGLRGFPRVEVRTNAENRGFAAGCNQGAAGATTEAVVFLNNDTVVPPGWLNGLLAPLTDPGVVATGPRSNMVSGLQLIEDAAGYSATTVEHVRTFAASWSARNAGLRRETRRLVGFCLAVRTTDLVAVGGFDEGFGLGGCEDDELCGRLAARGRLLVVDDVFIHHDGHVTFDTNGVDWHALQRANTSRLVELQSTASGSHLSPLPASATRDGASAPAVSVILLAERSTAHLRRALTSVAVQTLGCRALEVLVVVGGTDGRADVGFNAAAAAVADVLGRAPGLQVQLIEQDGPRSARLNAGLRDATGVAVTVLDTNEDWFGHHLALLTEGWDGRTGRYSYAVRCLQDAGLTVLQRGVEGDIDFDRVLLSLTRFIVPGTLLLPVDDVRAVGGFDESLAQGEYWELQLRMAAAGVGFEHIAVPSVRHYVPVEVADRGERPLAAAAVAAVYARHPLSRHSALAAQREAIVAQLRAEEAPPVDVSFVVVAGSGPDQLSELIMTLQTGLSVLTGSRWELVLVLPDRDAFAPILEQLDDVRVLVEPDATVPEALAAGAAAATGTYALQAVAGETVSPELVAAALRSGAQRVRVGVRLPSQRSASERRGVALL
jgi:GT2 family glycosyltransferase